MRRGQRSKAMIEGWIEGRESGKAHTMTLASFDVRGLSIYTTWCIDAVYEYTLLTSHPPHRPLARPRAPTLGLSPHKHPSALSPVVPARISLGRVWK